MADDTTTFRVEVQNRDHMELLLEQAELYRIPPPLLLSLVLRSVLECAIDTGRPLLGPPDDELEPRTLQ